MSSRSVILTLLLAYSYNNSNHHEANAFILPTPTTQITPSSTRVQIDSNTIQQQQQQQYQQHQIVGLASTTRDEEEVDTMADAMADALKTVSYDTEPKSFSKLLVLKDRMWVRNTLEDLTAAEFACNLAPRSSSDDEDGGEGGSKKKKKSAVDFENLFAKLDKRIEDMCVRSTYGEKDASCIVSYPLEESRSSDAFPQPEDECWSLMENSGMGSVTYTDDQRSALVLRLLASRQEIVKAMSGSGTKSKPKNGESSLEQIREKLQTTDIVEDDNKSNSKTNGVSDTYVYVRDDGTIDWDGALQDRAALKTFGTSVWARINGQDPESVDEDSIKDGSAVEGHGGGNQVTAKIVETEAIRDKKETLDLLKSELEQMEKAHTKLLNSAVSVGSAVANVNLALLEPELRSKIRASNSALEQKRDEVSFQTLIYELERIYTYLDGELGNTATKGYIPLQDRLNVAEFGLLESQIESMKSQIDSGVVLDSDVLSVVMEQTTDFKRRLGIDYYVAGLTFDQEAIKIWLNDLIGQLNNSLAFYGKGCQLFFNDCVFSTSLIGKALVGYTLKPREVRTLRRTFKDVITFVPVVIILIIPLTPIGHVLIFGAIQRFFPDFFPSCFTERRQNLLSLYESTEYSDITIEENWQEKIIRVLEAAGFFIVDNTKKFIVQAADGEGNGDEVKNKIKKE